MRNRDNNQSSAILNGAPFKTLLVFSLPIILGNVFQQLYNIVDAIVVGRFVGDIPLRGISIASPIMDIFYALLLGVSIGVGVLVGRLSGEGNWEKLKRVHITTLFAGGAVSLLFTAIGFLFSRSILLAQGYSEKSVSEAMQYLSIIYAGLIFCFFYNYLASALRSWGNSRVPFVVLLVSSTVHAGLDILLCGVFGLGITGVACSTVFCQILSTLWLALYIEKKCPALSLKGEKIRPDLTLLGSIAAYAWAAALQQAVVTIGRFLVQGMLAPLGESTVTGYNMGVRIEQFLFCFSQGISAAMVVAVAQNMGHGSGKRARTFYYTTLKCMVGLLLLLGSIAFFFAPKLVGIFSDNPDVIEAGTTYLHIMAFLYLLAFFGEAIQSFFRGLGRLRLTMIASVGSIILRVVLSYFLVPLWGIGGICAAVVCGWCLIVFGFGSYSLYCSRRI
ncbi:MAG: MATE family efflux transporter [Lachnospiraceae bacterium]|nr:MATE family efflux transporter [Lachnospiraceae bacterium]